MRRRDVLARLGAGACLAMGLADDLVGTAFAKGKADAARVTGPVEGGKHGWPFSAYFGGVENFGYIEEEYFIDGEATSYRPVGELGPDGRWKLEAAGKGPYKTRILVRRPADPAKFNGTVIVEWLNVSSGHDIALVGEGQFEGFAYVGVSNQHVGIHGFEKNPIGLKAWDPDRYGSLFLSSESLCYDIFTQAAHAVGPRRAKQNVDPLAGLEVRKVIATGGSQSAAKLLSYINGVQPISGAFDAIVPTIGAGNVSGFGDFIFDFSTPERIAQVMNSLRSQARVRDDLSIPVMLVNSESETIAYYGNRQPDTDKFRYWEVAGSSHGPAPMVRALNHMLERDGITPSVIAQAGEKTGIASSEIDWSPVADAAFVRVHEWINGGAPPPNQSPIEIIPGTIPTIARDPLGNAIGGVRPPEIEVPIACNVGNVPGVPALAGLGGGTTPFSMEELKRLYPTKADYVGKVTAAAISAEKSGVILPKEARKYISEANAMTFSFWAE